MMSKGFAKDEKRHGNLASIHCRTTTMSKQYCKKHGENSNNKSYNRFRGGGWYLAVSRLIPVNPQKLH